MKLTQVQKEMIQWRLEVTDAVAEVLQDTADYEQDFDYYMDAAVHAEKTLLNKLVMDSKLTPIEVDILGDVVGCCEQYADMAEQDIGFATSQQKASGIRKSMEQLEELLNTVLQQY